MAFFQEEKPPREPFLMAPASVIGLIAVILAAHTARVLVPEALSNQILEEYALVPARYSDLWTGQGDAPVSIWDAAAPFVGHLFLHADFLHAGMNCLLILIAGSVVARRQGALKFLTLFLLAGLLAAAVFVATNWGLLAAVIGASGAASGLMAAAIRIFYGERMANAAHPVPVNDGEGAGHRRHAPLAPLFSGPILFFSAIWCLANVIAGVLGLGTGSNVQAVAWEGHLGGYLAGLVLVGLFDAVRRPRTINA